LRQLGVRIANQCEQLPAAAAEQNVLRIDTPPTVTGPVTSSGTSGTTAQAGMLVVVPVVPVPVRRPTGETFLMHDPPTQATQDSSSPDSVSNDHSTSPSFAANQSGVSQTLVEVAEDISAPLSPGGSDELPDAGSGLSILALPASPPNDPTPSTATQSFSSVSAVTPSTVSSAEYESGVRPSSSASSSSLTGIRVQPSPSRPIALSLEQPPSAPQHPQGLSPPTTPLTGSATRRSSPEVPLPEHSVRRSLRLHPPAAPCGSPTGAEAQTVPTDSNHSPLGASHQPPSTPEHLSDFTTPRTSYSASRKRRALPTRRQRGCAVGPSLSAVSGATASGPKSPAGYESGVRPYSPEVSGLRDSESEGSGGHQPGPTLSGHALPEASRKRPHSEVNSASFITGYPPYLFKRAWFKSNPVATALDRAGFYITSEMHPAFGPRQCEAAIVRDLNAYFNTYDLKGKHRYNNCFHSLIQQVLVQDPIMYLIALGGMKVRNHRLISLPVAPLVFSQEHNSQLMDPGFPFAKFLANKREVPAINILYTLSDINLRIAPASLTKEDVQHWWQNCGGDMKVAATQLPLAEFKMAKLKGGHTIAFPPQQLWYVERTPPTASGENLMFEMKYISVNKGPDKNLDYEYWPEGTYERISQNNRDLTGPGVTGWGEPPDAPMRTPRFITAIELRGVWAIGDAILGLTSWNSPVVQRDLKMLFETDEGTDEWYSLDFDRSIQLKLRKKLLELLNDIDSIYEETFGNILEAGHDVGED